MSELARLQLALGPLMVDLGGEALAATERDLLCHPAVGAVILFTRNYRCKAQLRALVDEIKSVRTPSLLVAVDQEGGVVQRFSAEFYKLPAAGGLGKLYDREPQRGLALAEAAGELMAIEVLQSGVDFSFAPVLDCCRVPNPVIDMRAFHSEPSSVYELAGAYIAGMKRAGMAATGKHFPGHGSVTADSHQQLPVDSRTLAQLKQSDLLPFRYLAKQLDGIMTAHILFERIHAQLPAYSDFWLQQILRQDLNFGGVIFSDDLSMKGAGDEIDTPKRSIAALNAGCDMVLVCNHPDNARRTADKIGQQYVCDQSRLLAMKAKPNNVPTDPAALAEMADALAAV